MSEQQRQPTAESHASVEVTFKRSLTRKNYQTGKSNYPTINSGKMTIIRYVNGVKTITNQKYRRIQPSD